MDTPRHRNCNGARANSLPDLRRKTGHLDTEHDSHRGIMRDDMDVHSTMERVMPNALHELPPPCGSECTQDATGG